MKTLIIVINISYPITFQHKMLLDSMKDKYSVSIQTYLEAGTLSSPTISDIQKILNYRNVSNSSGGAMRHNIESWSRSNYEMLGFENTSSVLSGIKHTKVIDSVVNNYNLS